MILLQILIVLLLILIIFCIAPTIVIFRAIFYKRTNEGEARINDYIKPYMTILDEAEKKLSKLNFEEISIKSVDEITLKADYYNQKSKKTAILFHGYRSSPLSNCVYQASIFLENGYNILLVHMRGHGKSGGNFCSMGYMEQNDVLQWVELVNSNSSIEDIILYGVSMGASSIAYASDRILSKKVKAIVLDCGFSGIRDQIEADSKKMHVPYRSLLPLVRLVFKICFGGDINIKTTESLMKNKIPTLIIHGTTDSSVPYTHSEEIYEACGGVKEKLNIDNADHTCAMLEGGEYAKKFLLKFLSNNLNKYKEKKHE